MECLGFTYKIIGNTETKLVIEGVRAAGMGGKYHVYRALFSQHASEYARVALYETACTENC